MLYYSKKVKRGENAKKNNYSYFKLVTNSQYKKEFETIKTQKRKRKIM